jgi:superfamily II DNA or RNA helicase
MSLVLELAYHVPPPIRQRGASVFRRGAVLGATSGDDWLRARVQGQARRPYRVELRREGDDLRARCTCAAYASQAVCKHIWATLLWAEATGLDEPIAPPAPSEGQRQRAPKLLGDGDDDDRDPGTDAADERHHEGQRQDTSTSASVSPVLDEDFGAAEDADLADRELWAEHPERWLRQGRRGRGRRRGNSWRERLDAARYAALRPSADVWGDAEEHGRLFYVVNPEGAPHVLRLELFMARRRRDGGWGQRSPARLGLPDLDRDRRLEPLDRRILGLLLAQQGLTSWYEGALSFDVHRAAFEVLLPLLGASGRLMIAADVGEPGELTLDAGEPWDLSLEVSREQGKGPPRLTLAGRLTRGEHQLGPEQLELLLDGGWFVHQQRAMRYARPDSAFRWLRLLRVGGPLKLPEGEHEELLERLYRIGAPRDVRWPEDLAPRIEAPTPRPVLEVLPPPPGADDERRRAQPLALRFDYDGKRVAADDPLAALVIPEQRRVLERDHDQEARAIERLRQLGARPARVAAGVPGVGLEITPSSLDELMLSLVGEGWQVERAGTQLRSPGALELSVEGSGIDWFDLAGGVTFGDQRASLPALLKALSAGKRTVTLDDGSLGVLPESWLSRYGLLLAAGEVHDDRLRFKPTQISLLDALLADREHQASEAFIAARGRLSLLSEAPRPARAPAGFEGKLRPYQREGLGWLRFLRELGLGGCLADDMGLGKTVQTLALLQHDKRARQRGKRTHKPSLVVVPRSLVHNWQVEAARFTPELVVLEHRGPKRATEAAELVSADLIVTTYGTLRRDVLLLKDIAFAVVILDEAQAIKNAGTESAKAARLLDGELRLALSGTPVENRLSELWSLFSFLEPGLLGLSTSFSKVAQRLRSGDAAVEELSRILRPLLLRRTKSQVASDLPPRVEQVLRCELEGEARERYDELREHYRQALLASKGGLGSRVKILEGLLRLRQAACHPGLIDKERAHELPSAKLDLLEDRLEAAIGEGHKALVFSQFTQLLGLLRARLDARGVVYEYLDGRTRKRAERVDRFQSDPDCPLFLISLKAGGFGLNLTAADYVFLLDPWWNPAVENQAIDRTHRIGQTRPVMAYRLIAEDTVEDKVLELQQRKAALAEAIFSGAANVLSELTRDDLEHLLS